MYKGTSSLSKQRECTQKHYCFNTSVEKAAYTSPQSVRIIHRARARARARANCNEHKWITCVGIEKYVHVHVHVGMGLRYEKVSP